MSNKLQQLLRQYPSSAITEDELAQLLGGSPDSRHSLLSRAVKNTLLIRLKRGLYCLGESLRQRPIQSFALAQKIYGPSYISLESALSYHGLIPEAVRTVTSVSIKRNKNFSTPLGDFSYSHLPTDNFFIGVQRITNGRDSYFMATVWKALLDYIYCYKHNWTSFEPVIESLRIEMDALPKIKRLDLINLADFYQSQRINRFITKIPKELIDEH